MYHLFYLQILGIYQSFFDYTLHPSLLFVYSAEELRIIVFSFLKLKILYYALHLNKDIHFFQRDLNSQKLLQNRSNIFLFFLT